MIAGFLWILAMTPLGSHAYWDYAWKKEMPPQERGMGSLSHSIAIDPADRSHIAYTARSRSGDYSLRHAVREGESWMNELVNPACTDSAVRIVVGDSGSLHICYQGKDGLSQQTVLMHAIHDTNQWTNQVVSSGGSGCSIALDPQGYPYISHIDSNGELKLARYDGGQWTSEVVALGANADEPTSMAIAHSGEIHLAFVSDTDPSAISWVRDGSGSWVSSIIDNGKQVGLVLDSTGRPRVVYNPDSGASVMYAQFDGLQWTTFSILQNTYMPHADQFAHHPVIAIDSRDAVHISYGHNWEVFDEWIGELDYARYDGITWETSNSIQVSLDGFSFAPSIALDSYGFPRVSYNIPPSHSTVRFAYFVTPELSGAWSRFTVKNRESLYTLKGSLKIQNTGEGYAATVQVGFFLSDDMYLSSEDIPLGQAGKITRLKSGKRKTARFSWDTTENPSGKYVLAVIDPDGLNLEKSKTDNLVPQLIP